MQGNHIIIGIILLLIIWALIEQKFLVTSNYRIKSARLPKQLNHTGFVVLADLHNRTFGKDNERLVKRIEKLKPEYILVAGDMINKKVSCYPSNGYTLLESLAKKYKIYYAYGNHEQKMELYQDSKVKEHEYLYSTWVEFKRKLSALNVTFLDNDFVNFTKGDVDLRITGISIGLQYFERNQIPEMIPEYLNNLVGTRNREQYQILIAHNPIYFNHYAHWGADLVISGHLHGGMMRLPGLGGIISPQAKFFPKYQSGEYSENGLSMVVSRGLGSHSIMPRLFNIPELVYIELENE